jgi:glycosyltransferase involved in cell wall biosynthesis
MNTEKPLVSVIISAYNHEKYVEQTLNSILEDSYPNKEIVIINDGSKDATHDIISAWTDKNAGKISVNYLSRENKGLTRTLNELITRTKGEIILPIASDDFLVNDTISERVEALCLSDKLIMISDSMVVDDQSRMISDSGVFNYYRGKKEKYFSESGLISEILFNWSLVGPVCLIKKEAFSTVGLYDTDLIQEDWDFFFRAAALRCVMFYDRTVAGYRVHSTSTHKDRSKIMRLKKDAVRTIFKNIEKLSTAKRIRMCLKLGKVYLSMIKTVLGG